MVLLLFKCGGVTGAQLGTQVHFGLARHLGGVSVLLHAVGDGGLVTQFIDMVSVQKADGASA